MTPEHEVRMPQAGSERLTRQLAFFLEADRLKTVLRRTLAAGASRRENAAEHSWHLVLMALLLHEYAAEPKPDLARALKMLVVHDLVEIDAGDTFAYDDEAHRDKAEREERAARRLFGLLPDDQREEFYALWKEFEERRTPEAKFAAALDRLQPMMLNYASSGYAWKRYGVTAGQVLDRNRIIADGSPALWEYAETLVREAVSLGFLPV